jgi:hypothetical protein
MSTPIDRARDRRAVSPQKAREQSADFHGFAASVDIQIGDDVFEIPNPSLLDDDQQERFNDLQAEVERDCDREDDIVIAERTLEDGTVIPTRTLRGDLKQPYAIKGEPLRPAYNTRLAKALFGEQRYERFKAGGGRSNQIALIWGQMHKEFEERRKSDPKSVGSFEGSEIVSNGDSFRPVVVPPPADS